MRSIICGTVNHERKMFKALSLDDVYQAFQPKPLKISELEEFYEDTKKARGDAHPMQRILRALNNPGSGSKHFLFIGHIGCGKSTELNRIQKSLQETFSVINISVRDELNILTLNYVDLILLVIDKLLAFGRDEKIPFNRTTLENVRNWAKTKEMEEVSEKYALAEAEVGIGTTEDGLLAWISGFFAKAKLAAKNTSSFKEVIKTVIEPKVSQLITFCNDLITEIQLEIIRRDKKGLVLILEDMDKVKIERAKEIFLYHSAQLTELGCNVLYTYPVALYHHADFNQVKPYFGNNWELPMIKVRDKDGTPFPPAMETMRKIAFSRMEPELFESESLIDQLILDSGGCLRDFFRMILNAADEALDGGRQSIGERDCQRAIWSLKKDYAASLSETEDESGDPILVKEFYEVLVPLCKDVKAAEFGDSRAALKLRQNLCILNYNGEGWIDVHPIVKLILIDRGLWDGKRESS